MENKKQDTMPDTMREQLIRLIYETDELAKTHDDCTEDEFITRVFKGRIERMGFDQNKFYYEFFGLWWKVLKPLFEFCEKNNLVMHVFGTKEYEIACLEISMNQD